MSRMNIMHSPRRPASATGGASGSFLGGAGIGGASLVSDTGAPAWPVAPPHVIDTEDTEVDFQGFLFPSDLTMSTQHAVYPTSGFGPVLSSSLAVANQLADLEMQCSLSPVPSSPLSPLDGTATLGQEFHSSATPVPRPAESASSSATHSGGSSPASQLITYHSIDDDANFSHLIGRSQQNRSATVATLATAASNANGDGSARNLSSYSAPVRASRVSASSATSDGATGGSLLDEYLDVLSAETTVDLERLRELARHAGVPPAVRAQVWLHLLGVRPADRSHEQSSERERARMYECLRGQIAGVGSGGSSSNHPGVHRSAHHGNGGASGTAGRGRTGTAGDDDDNGEDDDPGIVIDSSVLPVLKQVRGEINRYQRRTPQLSAVAAASAAAAQAVTARERARAEEHLHQRQMQDQRGLLDSDHSQTQRHHRSSEQIASRSRSQSSEAASTLSSSAASIVAGSPSPDVYMTPFRGRTSPSAGDLHIRGTGLMGQRMGRRPLTPTASPYGHYEPDFLRSLLERVLATYLLANSDIEYHPAMVSMLAPFVVAVRRERDVYFCFDALMAHVTAKLGFQAPRGDEYAFSTGIEFSQQLGHAASLFRTTLPDLYNFFDEEEVEYKDWLAPWLQGLFAQEFPIDALLRLWDVYFADGLDLHPYVCLAVLHTLKDRVEDLECSEILGLLRRLPFRESDVEDLIYLARNIRLEVQRSMEFESGFMTPSHDLRAISR